MVIGIEIWFKVTTHPLPILLGKRVNHFGQRGEVIPGMPRQVMFDHMRVSAEGG